VVADSSCILLVGRKNLLSEAKGKEAPGAYRTALALIQSRAIVASKAGDPLCVACIVVCRPHNGAVAGNVARWSSLIEGNTVFQRQVGIDTLHLFCARSSRIDDHFRQVHSQAVAIMDDVSNIIISGRWSDRSRSLRGAGESVQIA